MPTATRSPASNTPARKTAAGKTAPRKTTATSKPPPAAKTAWRVRVRMYRHGLGDCFLLSFARRGRAPLQMLIDCGALSRDKAAMNALVGEIRDTLLAEAKAAGGSAAKATKARLDVVVGTHEHLDHLSGFNQARKLFDDGFDIGAVWLAWTENSARPEVHKLKQRNAKALAGLQALVARAGSAGAAPGLAAAAGPVAELIGFSQADDTVGTGTVAEAMAYLKLRGTQAGDLRYLEPGSAPFMLPGLAATDPAVRVYVLGPPTDASLIRTSAITDAMKRDDVVYHLGAAGPAGIDALAAALSEPGSTQADAGQPFEARRRIGFDIAGDTRPDAPAFPGRAALRALLRATYDDAEQAWRRIDDDWASAFGQLALNLDNDTNNTSLVLAFEQADTAQGEVLLFVADAQIGSWLSWRDMRFTLPPTDRAAGRQVSTDELMQRTVFYKVGHHSSHNATAKAGGLERMHAERLVAFVPLDRATAKAKGRKGADGQPSGWDMPAAPLLKGLTTRTHGRVVISDVKDKPPAAALTAGVVATATYIDYYLR